MSDPINNSLTIDATTPVAEPGEVAVTPAKPAEKKPAAAPKSRASKAKPADEATKHKCAFCHKVVVFEKTTTVGTREPVTYHGCDESNEAVFAWMQATHLDASTPDLVTSED